MGGLNPAMAQPTNTPPSASSGTSTNQQGGITAGTVIINAPVSFSNQTPQQRSETIDGIAALMNEGDDIVQTFLNKDDANLIKQQYVEWANKTYNYLNVRVGLSYAVQFKNSHGNAMMGLPVNHSVEGGSYTQEIRGKILTLNDFITELRRN
jgi:hypothetical protein